VEVRKQKVKRAEIEIQPKGSYSGSRVG
jgi:hypothetical protein